MPQQNTEVDVESLQKCDRRRGSCLDVFLVSSVIFLFTAVAALAVAGVMVVKELRSQQRPSFQMPEFGTASLIGGTPSPAFKMQNFAYLEPTSASIELLNATLNWTPVHYGEGTSLGSNYEFNNDQFSLKPRREGSYFMYINLKVTCIAKCKAGVLNLNVANKLTCDVELSAHKTSVSKKCWTVSPLLGESMVIKMTVPEEGLQNWKLDMPDSSFGIFLVD
ncbi:uncharacterized protein LOC121637895 [Melanotaenia boesemani]|uniref:uncharacterized protein LOC121637895 n=1 Tax=Melanotaenia boesemani TaxID=1250792 RepID=UPI001C052BEF|nr:uncharacterized protein LOC121637895 [Melanotaenia boesemani]